MNVSLTPRLEDLVAQRVASGRYGSASEVIREALRLLEDRDMLRSMRLEELRKQIAIGIDQADRGEYAEYDETSLAGMAERIKTEGRKRLARRKKTAP